MTTKVLAEVTASITEIKANPKKVAGSAYGDPVSILNRNEPYKKALKRLDSD